METPGRSMPPTRDDDDDDDEMTSPFDMIRSVPRTAMGHSVAPKVPRRPSIEVVDVLPGKTRIVFACMLPLLMIAATFALQKKAHARPHSLTHPLTHPPTHPSTHSPTPLTHPLKSASPCPNPHPNPNQVMLNAGSPLRHRERSVFDRNNALLLNRSCAPQLQSAVLRAGPLPSDASDSVRLVVGGGFAASGLSAVASMIQNVPGACHPSRVDPSFWSSIADSTSSFTEDQKPRPSARVRVRVRWGRVRVLILDQKPRPGARASSTLHAPLAAHRSPLTFHPNPNPNPNPSLNANPTPDQACLPRWRRGAATSAMP